MVMPVMANNNDKVIDGKNRSLKEAAVATAGPFVCSAAVLQSVQTIESTRRTQSIVQSIVTIILVLC